MLTQGRTGLVVPAGDVRSLMIALADLIDGKYNWRSMREEAYRATGCKWGVSRTAVWRRE
ncbi:hypothetical protein NSMM_800082 [Nitrosomonas mobilis]|uniref:Uncharacterized protein n=1 Tax=Nitrosomonas mobilis TaxID=51642 RepID=A0A1G5SID2_9PROT|nr:hypothetical protein NSMM_800082 [Nitrosomonas mobilis]